MRVRSWRWLLPAGTLCLAIWACGDFDSDTTAAAPGIDASPSDAPALPSDANSTETSLIDGSAAPVDSSVDAPPPRTHRWVFVTSRTHDAKFGEGDGGLAGADQFCANQVLGTPYEGLRWRAWLGTAALDPRDRIADAGKVPYDYRLITGPVVLEANYGFLPGAITLEHPIDRDESGDAAPEVEVWTGSDTAGRTYGTLHCSDWTSLSGEALTGWAKSPVGETSPGAWTSTSYGSLDRRCSAMHRVYCFEVD